MTELIPEPHNNHAETGAPEEAPQPVEASEQRAAAERAALAPEAVNARRDTSGAIPREQPPDPEAGAASNEATGPRSADQPVESAAGLEPRSDAADSPTGAVPNSGAQPPAIGVSEPEPGDHWPQSAAAEDSAPDEDGAPDDETAADNGDAQRGDLSLHDVRAGGDVNAAGRDLYLTKYLTGLAHLLPHRVTPSGVLASELFVGDVPRPSAGCGVVVLAGERDSGRRTTALRLLAERMGTGQLFELNPDWERPNVAQIPCDPKTGYLLDLTGQDGLDEVFHRRLTDYAAASAREGSLLIVLGDAEAWRGIGHRPGAMAVCRIERPDAREVARRRIAAAEDRSARERARWLTSGSVFAGKLRADAAPGRGVELASIILTADNDQDAEALDRFQLWQSLLNTWFGEKSEARAEDRALQIGAAFLDGAPARTVLDSADRLLAAEEMNWSPERGGLLAAADDEARCRNAHLDFVDGSVGITGSRPGVDRALILHLWEKRPRMVPVLRDWLADISAPGGPAAKELPRLADALTELAAAHGPQDVLDLAVQWLNSGKSAHVDLAARIVDRLAIDPWCGTEVRAELTNWAKGATMPQRQRAVADAVGGEFGRAYPRVALTRLRYVFDHGKEETVRRAAVEALVKLVAPEGMPIPALQAAVEWAERSAGESPSGTAFLSLFAEPASENASGPAELLFSLQGEDGIAARDLLVRGGVALWNVAAHSTPIADLLAGWRQDAEAGRVPEDPVVEVASRVASESLGWGDPRTRQAVGMDGRVSNRIAERVIGVARGMPWQESAAPVETAEG